ncbi:MAG: hypothetical protein Kow0074_10660 [Candidatus Zixiibacteriota bacterium]
MKKLVTGWALLAAILLVAGLAGCEGDQGPAGPPGTASCMGCHTDQFDSELATFLKPYQTQFSFSKHGTGDTYERNSASCARCHTSEGFQHFVNTGEAIEVPGSSQIHCFTCHAPHTTENFSVRVTSAVALDVGGTYDKGTSNVCATCHQARVPSPAIAGGGEASGRWGPHHGPQSNLLTGQGFYSFDGSDYPNDAGHNSISTGCVNCHMAEPMGPLVGGHSFWLHEEGDEAINVNGCGCHGTWDEESAHERVHDVQTEFEEKLEMLVQDMAALGWVNPESASGFVIRQTFTEQQLGAIWNYLMLKEDLSGSVHNPITANAVLEATQAFVDAQSGSSSLASFDNMKTK